MQNFSDATYKNILDYMLSLVPDTYDKRDTSPIQTSLGPAAYVLEGFYLSLDLVQKQAFVQTAAGDSLDLLAVLAGITRKQASAAVKVGIFDCEVPIGARFSTINGTESSPPLRREAPTVCRLRLPVISATDTPAPFCRLIPLKD